MVSPVPTAAGRNGITNPGDLLRLRAALLVAGAAVMVLQIVGTRIIGPHFGAGLSVWTALITVTLVALAAGYFLGGILADRYPLPRSFAGVLLAAAAAIALVPVLRAPVIDLGWSIGIRGGALLAATILFLPALVLLGMASPFAIRLEARGVSDAGRSAGRLYAISTAGSVVGAVLAGYVLVPMLRIPVLLAILATTLAVAAVIAAVPGIDARVAIAAAVIAAVSFALASRSPKPANLVAARSFEGTDLRVVEDNGVRFLLMDHVIQSTVNAEGRPTDKYAYFLASRVLLARPEARRVAVIGVGGGGLLNLLTEKGLHVEGVDLSPEVIDLARGEMGLTLPASQLHAADGRVWLRRHPAAFDVVILDAFAGDKIAASLVSREGLAVAKAALASGGLLAVNTWGIDPSRGRPNQTGAAIRATLRDVFGHVLEVPAAGNLLLFAADEPVVAGRDAVELAAFDGPRTFTWLDVAPVEWPAAAVLADDRNPIDVIDVADREAARVGRRESMPVAVREALAWE
ncbi:MAG: fused MFS/spermidine synthase [Planctomycetaceae bacterium]